MATQRFFIFIIGCAISTAAIFFVFKTVQWNDLLQSFKSLPLWSVPLCILFYLAGFIPRAIRSHFMLLKVETIPTVICGQAVVTGYAANNILPFRLGEFARAFYLFRKTNISYITSLCSIVAERILDGFCIVILWGLSICFFLLDNSIEINISIKLLFIISAVLFSSAILLILVLVFSKKWIVYQLSTYSNSSFSSLFSKILDAFAFYNSNSDRTKVALLSLVVWIIEGLSFVVLVAGMGIANPFAVGFFCLGLINLGILLPSAPGYVGIFQALGIMGFVVLGFRESDGLAFSLVLHASQFIPVTLMGLVIFFHHGLNLKTVLNNSKILVNDKQ